MGKTEGDGAALKKAIRRMDSVQELVRKYPDELLLATTAADIRRASSESKIACLMGVEGGHIIEGELAALRALFRLGARYMTLTHSFNTAWADSSGTGGAVDAEHEGLTGFGDEIVLEMNRLGMMVDVSQVGGCIVHNHDIRVFSNHGYFFLPSPFSRIATRSPYS